MSNSKSLISGKEFISLVRKSTPDMDGDLEKIYNRAMSELIDRTYTRAFFFQKRQRDFARGNQAKFWEELNNIRERVTKLGYFGIYLDELCLDIYTNEFDVETYVNKILSERKIRQEQNTSTKSQSTDSTTQNSLFEN